MSFRQQSASPFRRPHLDRSQSSSPSLFGMERSIPNFQDFVKRLPPADAAKPLPPVPLVPRRASSDWPPRSRSPSSHGNERGRRASSVYSRTASMWQGDAVSFSSADFADEPMPPLPTLQPLAYSMSTPQLGETLEKEDSDDTRACRPLIGTPSPTASRGRTPSPSRRRASGPIPQRSPAAVKKTVQTVSIEQAKRNVHAPGAIHLLPEELRAKTIKKRTSDELLRMDSVDMFSPMASTHPQKPTTLIDHQGRHRSIVSFPQTSTAPGHSSAVAVATGKLPYQTSFKVGVGPERHMDSHNLNEQQQRGRTRERTKRVSGPQKRRSDAKKDMGSANASSAAIQYRSLVSDHHPARSQSSGYHDTDSDDSIKTRMKLVPHPLFRTKPPAKLPGAITGHGYGSEAPRGQQPKRRGSRDSRSSSKSSRGSFPFGLSLSPPSLHRRRSTSGSIPISPPMGVSVSPQGTKKERPGASPFRRESEDTRESAYYPYVGPRKKKAQTMTPPPIPILSADGPASRFNTPIFGTESGSNYSNSINRTDSLGGTSSRASEKLGTGTSKSNLLSRAARSAAKYVDLLTKPPSPPSSPTHYNRPIHARPPDRSSTHLLPAFPQSPSSDHLGWSTKAKHAFDEACTSLQALSPTSNPRGPVYEHISTPARPLDETRIGLREGEEMSSSLSGEARERRKMSLLGGRMLEGWVEDRAEKRRQELKRIISVVPGSTRHHGSGGPASEGWM